MRRLLAGLLALATLRCAWALPNFDPFGGAVTGPD